MGYFANGTEGEIYEAKYCARCVHGDEDRHEFGCPVWNLHLLWNYDASGRDADETKNFVLSAFIPIEGTRNGECQMFTEPPQAW